MPLILKNIHKIEIISIILIIILGIFNLISFGKPETTLGESSFPAEENDYFIWKCVNSTDPKHNIGDLIRFTVEKIYNETFDGIHSLIVNYTIENYNFISGLWIPQQTNTFYMAYNKTKNFLNWSMISYRQANIYLVPIPVNLTLIGDAIASAGFLNYSISGDKLVLDYRNSTIVQLTINPDGISTTIEKITNGSLVYKWELNTSKIIVVIPLGNSFIIYVIISIVSLTILLKKKMKLKQTTN
ncbi:MAG: hypothetical protein ACTSRH_07955 [Promethearchaeota archaeon]